MEESLLVCIIYIKIITRMMINFKEQFTVRVGASTRSVPMPSFSPPPFEVKTTFTFVTLFVLHFWPAGVLPFEESVLVFKNKNENRKSRELLLIFPPLLFFGWAWWDPVSTSFRLWPHGNLPTKTVYFDKEPHRGPIPPAFWTEVTSWPGCLWKLFFRFLFGSTGINKALL